MTARVLITDEMIDQAKERLVLSRATHLDQLIDKLKEDRVRQVILPMILGEELDEVKEDDMQYCADLGIIQKVGRNISHTNTIYQEIIPRELTEVQQVNFNHKFQPDWVKADGSIDAPHLIKLFRQFWLENREAWSPQMAGYQETAPQLIFQAFLQRVANGHGFIAQEYALGRGRTDLMLKWKAENGEEQRIVMELKILSEKQSLDSVIEKGLEQTAQYAESCQATESHLIIFDRSQKTDWATNPLEKEASQA